MKHAMKNKPMAVRNKKITWLTELPDALAFAMLTISLPYIMFFISEMIK